MAVITVVTKSVAMRFVVVGVVGRAEVADGAVEEDIKVDGGLLATVSNGSHGANLW